MVQLCHGGSDWVFCCRFGSMVGKKEAGFILHLQSNFLVKGRSEGDSSTILSDCPEEGKLFRIFGRVYFIWTVKVHVNYNCHDKRAFRFTGTFVIDDSFEVSDVIAMLTMWVNNYVFLQGDLIVIPAGCPHQVENISELPTVKIAQDFVAEHSVSRCWDMIEEVSLSWENLILNIRGRYNHQALRNGLQ